MILKTIWRSQQDESQMVKIALIEANDFGISFIFAISENCQGCKANNPSNREFHKPELPSVKISRRYDKNIILLAVYYAIYLH